MKMWPLEHNSDEKECDPEKDGDAEKKVDEKLQKCIQQLSNKEIKHFDRISEKCIEILFLLTKIFSIRIKHRAICP